MMSKHTEDRDKAARAKRNQEMASDLITRVEHSQNHHARAAHSDQHKRSHDK